ncbi:MAG: DUF883 domain-containing protein, partial [Phenylobacterium sp.]|nr:DUF883 domain-containing protein [Phenylobacterium sp.]
MSESNRPTTIQDKLIADVKLIVADAEALVHATADQAEEKVADLRARLQANLKAAQDRLAEAETTLVDATPETFRAAVVASALVTSEA